MKRRDFLKVGGGAAGGAAFAGLFDGFAEASEPKTAEIRDHFESDSAEVLALAQRVFDKCILEKLRQPAAPLRHTWIQPGGSYYVGQWIWDTMFVVDLLSLLPDKKQVIRDIFQNYWDFQDRWNKDAPEYARDMITAAIKTEPQVVRQSHRFPSLPGASSGSIGATATRNFSGSASAGSSGSTTGIGGNGICTTTG